MTSICGHLWDLLSIWLPLIDDWKLPAVRHTPRSGIFPADLNRRQPMHRRRSDMIALPSKPSKSHCAARLRSVPAVAMHAWQPIAKNPNPCQLTSFKDRRALNRF